MWTNSKLYCIWLLWNNSKNLSKKAENLWYYNMMIRKCCIVLNWCTSKVHLNSLQWASTAQNNIIDKSLIRFLYVSIAIREQWFSFRNCVLINLTNLCNLGYAIITNDILIIIFRITKFFSCLIQQLRNCVYKFFISRTCLEGRPT